MTAPTSSDLAFGLTGMFGNLRASLLQQLFTVWYSLPEYRNAADWLDISLPMILSAEETISLATSTYMQMQLEALGSSDTTEAPDPTIIIGEPLRGVDPSIVYTRPFKEVWESLGKGKTLAEAIDDGANRLRQLVETDLQLAHTHTSRTLLRDRNDVVGFKRVPTGTFTCALCLVASTQRYHKLDLMPIHPGCDCRVAPIIDSADTGQIIDKEFLEEIHKAVERQFGMSARDARKIDYRKIPIVHNHGEFGPTLAVRGQHFTTL